MIEVIDSIASSQMQTSVNEIAKGSTDNQMNINTLKNKEMIIDLHCHVIILSFGWLFK